MRARTFHKQILIFAILIVLIFSSLMVNYAEDNSEIEWDLTEESGAAGKTARQSMETNKTFMNFTVDGCNGTYIDDRNVTLAWQPPLNPYQEDESTNLLCHFNNKYEGENNEVGEIVDKSCVGLWNFNEGKGTIINDRSGNGKNGNIIGATWSSMPSGSALEFDGLDDYVLLSDIPLTNLTISHWVKPDVVNLVDISLVTRRNGNSVPCNYQTQIDNGKFQFSRYLKGVWNGYQSVASLTAGNWYFLTATVEGGTLKLYINGNFDSQHSITGIDSTGTPQTTSIGQNRAGGNWFDGKIDEIAIYKRAKTAQEIKADYNQVSYYIPFETGKFRNGVRIEDNITLAYPLGPSPDSSCVGLWRFDEDSGTTVMDISDNTNYGTMKNSPEWVDGVTGKALEFDGIADYVQVPDDNSLDISSDITIEAWMRSNGLQIHHAGMIHKFNGDGMGNYMGYRIRNGGNNFQPIFEYCDKTSGISSINGPSLSYDQWYHIAAVKDGTVMKIFIDGIQTKSGTGAASIAGNTVDLFIGKSDYNNAYFNGTIDEVVIYNRAKSAKEIYQDYIGNFDKHQGTIEMWVKPDWNGNDGENHTIFSTSKDWNNNSFFIYKDSDNYLKFVTTDNNSNFQGYPKVDIRDWKKNNWYNLAFTWDVMGTKTIYINGYKMATASNNYMPVLYHSSLNIGSTHQNFNSFEGVIDELRISNKARSAFELREYLSVGTYESDIIDVAEPVAWDKISWNAQVPANTNIYFQTRASIDNITWSSWTGNEFPSDLELGAYFDSTGEPINALPSRYIQWRAVLKSTDGIYSPILYNVTITWNHLPKAVNVTITPAKPTIHDELVIDYDYSDIDGDAEGATTFEWMVDRGTGVFVGSGIYTQNLAPKWTAFNERWFCTITPHDGKNYGFPVESAIVKIAKGNITEILITPAYVEVSADDTVQFTAKALDADNNEISTAFLWNITSGGTIDQTGLFSPENTGLHFVYASAEGVFGAAMVTVTPGVLDHILITPENPKITTDDIIEFNATFHDAENNTMVTQNLTWNVSGGGSIDPITGVFEASTPGEFTVSARANNTTGYTTIKIKPGAPDRLNLTPQNPTITTDDQLQFDVEAYDKDNNEITTDFDWLVENGEITSNGLFTPANTGTWKVSVLFNVSGIEANTTITVLHGQLTKLALDPAKHTMSIEDEISFTTIGSDAKSNHWTDVEDVQWSIDDPAMGDITQEGTFKAENSGGVTVT
ncbi:LamG domain-containing protein, partial [[Eubacterium] cellulosolvens]